MNTETFRAYSVRLNLLYARYAESLCAAFLPSAPRAVRVRAERPEHRWEDEGGKPK